MYYYIILHKSDIGLFKIYIYIPIIPIYALENLSNGQYDIVKNIYCNFVIYCIYLFNINITDTLLFYNKNIEKNLGYN